LVTSKDFGPSTISFDRTKHISEKHHREVVRRSDTERGDVLMSMIGGNIGKALIVDTDREFSIKNVALFKSCDAPALARFVLYYLQSGLLGIQIALLSKGGAQGFLGLGQIRNLQVAMMPANEMEDIVQALDLRLRDYDGLIAALRNSIDLVTEYRTRLVADVVTGKLDVREAAALLPDEAAPDTVTDDTDLSDETEPSDEEAAV
jgi:type I restriction enzyme S subunit